MQETTSVATCSMQPTSGGQPNRSRELESVTRACSNELIINCMFRPRPDFNFEQDPRCLHHEILMAVPHPVLKPEASIFASFYGAYFVSKFNCSHGWYKKR